MAELRVDPHALHRAHPIEDGEALRVVWIHHSDRSSTAVIAIAPGRGLGAHFHRDHDEVIHVADGSADFRLGDEIQRVEAGTVLTIPAQTVHAPIYTESGCLLVSVFAPGFDPTNPDRVFVDD